MQVKDKEKRKAGDGFLYLYKFLLRRFATLLCYDKGTIVLENEIETVIG